jgi:hypothetical protein
MTTLILRCNQCRQPAKMELYDGKCEDCRPKIFIIDTPRSANGDGAPFTIEALDLDEALNKIVAHMGLIWQRGEYSLREVRP